MRKTNSSTAGMTLLEVLIATGIFAIILATALTVLVQTQPMVNTSTAKVALEEQARKITEEMARELRKADRQSFTLTIPKNTGAANIDFQADGLTFTLITDFDNLGERIEDDTITYQLIPRAGEIADDDIDNNNNGLVDEQVLQKTVDDITSGQTITIELANNVVMPDDAAIFTRVVNPRDRMRIHLVLAKRDPNGDNDTIHRAEILTNVLVTNGAPD